VNILKAHNCPEPRQQIREEQFGVGCVFFHGYEWRAMRCCSDRFR
jgi:hypothetical protein